MGRAIPVPRPAESSYDGQDIAAQAVKPFLTRMRHHRFSLSIPARFSTEAAK